MLKGHKCPGIEIIQIPRPQSVNTSHTPLVIRLIHRLSSRPVYHGPLGVSCRVSIILHDESGIKVGGSIGELEIALARPSRNVTSRYRPPAGFQRVCPLARKSDFKTTRRTIKALSPPPPSHPPTHLRFCLPFRSPIVSLA